MSLALLALLLCVPAAARKPGKVQYATLKQAFVDVGAVDGVAVDAVLAVTRQRRKVGDCKVTQASAHHAVCDLQGALPGDTFALANTPQTTTAVESMPTKLKPASALVLAARRDAVFAAPLKQVAFDRSHRVRGPSATARASVDLSHRMYLTTSAGTMFQRPSLSASAHATVGFVPGLFAGAAVRVLGDVLAPPNQRGRPGELFEVYVYEAVVGVDGPLPVVAQAGRFVPRKTPGLAMLDGAQVGARVYNDRIEAGVYAGLIPDALTLYPSLQRISAGVYTGLDIALGDSMLILPRVRAGVTTPLGFRAARGELAAETQLLWGTVWAVGLDARASAATTGALALEHARVDVDVTPFSDLHLGTGYAYTDGPAFDLDAARGPNPIAPVARSQHAYASADWRAVSWLGIGASVGATLHDVPLRPPLRAWAGPELALPRMFGDWGGVRIGYAEEFGADAGRSTWVTGTLAPFADLSTSVRVTVAQNAPDFALQTDGLAYVDYRIWRFFSLRARALVSQSLPTPTPIHPAQQAFITGVVTDVGINATF